MNEVKELYAKLELCADDNERLSLLFSIATSFLNFDEQRVLQIADDIKELAERIDSNWGRCYYYSTRGRVFYKKSLLADCEAEFTKALNMALLTPDLVLQAMCHDSLGAVYTQQFQYESALDSSFKALAIYEQIGDITSQKYKAVCYNNIGVAYRKMNERGKAEENYLKAIDMPEDMLGERMKNNILNNLCEIKIAQGEYTAGMDYAIRSREGFRQLNHKNGEVHAIVLIAHCYLGSGEVALALQHFIAALKMLKEVDHKPIEICALRGLGEVYMKMDAPQEAIKHFRKGLDMARAIDDDEEACEVLYCLVDTQRALKLHAEAKQSLALGIELATRSRLSYQLGRFTKQAQSL
jgi:tetratricopeptide (TPR) repeat protein